MVLTAAVGVLLQVAVPTPAPVAAAAGAGAGGPAAARAPLFPASEVLAGVELSRVVETEDLLKARGTTVLLLLLCACVLCPALNCKENVHINRIEPKLGLKI